jgi:hypothetical protein
MEIYCIKNLKTKVAKNTGQLFKYSLIIALFLFIRITVQAQSDLITLKVNDVSIEIAIDEIREQTDVSFILNDEEISQAPRITVSLEEVTVEEALTEILKNTGLTFEKVNNTIVITPIKESSNKTSEDQDVLRQTIRGKVFDKDSKTELSFATVHVLNTDPIIGATTDIDGNFVIKNVPVGRHTLKVTFVGYADAYVPEILLGSAKEVVLTIELSEQVQSLGGLTILGSNGEPVNEMAIVNAKAFNAEETKRYAATIGDPARMAQVFAGVSGTDDASNEIVIRGNSPNWLLWRLEGVEIPSPNHFAEEGYSSGAISILSANMLGNSDFYTGAFPAEYGNALSGVFDINLRNGNNQENEFTFQAGVLGIDLSAEGPFKKGYGGSFIFNYRYSTLSLLNDFGIQVSENTIADYQDLSFKINLPSKKFGTFSLWGIGGLSSDDEKYLPDSSDYFDDGYSDYTQTGMYATGISHTIFTDKRSYVQTVFSLSNSYSSEDFQEMDQEGQLNGTFFDELQNRAFRISSYYNRKFSNKLSLRTGVKYNKLNYSYYSRTRNDSTQEWNTFLNSDGKTNLYQVFAQVKQKFSDKVILTAGLDYVHFALSNDNVIEPRLGLVIGLPNEQKLGFGYGKHSKHENLPVYLVENELDDGSIYMPNKSLKMARAHHFLASYEKRFKKDFLFKAEAYFQYITDLPVPTNPDKFWSPIFGGIWPEDTLANIGKGRNYGLELTLQKFFSNNYYLLVTSSLFDSKFKPADGQWRDTRYNIHYINNFVGGKEFKWGEKRMVGLNAKIIWSGGKRQTPIDLEASIEEGEAVYEWDEIFSEQNKDYLRLDIGVRLHFYRTKAEHVLSLDIQNVTNRLNTWTQIYDSENESIVDYPMSGLIPIVSYRVEF